MGGGTSEHCIYLVLRPHAQPLLLAVFKRSGHTVKEAPRLERQRRTGLQQFDYALVGLVHAADASFNAIKRPLGFDAHRDPLKVLKRLLQTICNGDLTILCI